jgi:hypothetical protein
MRRWWVITTGACLLAALCSGCNNSDIVAAEKSGGPTVYGAPNEDRSVNYPGAIRTGSSGSSGA